VFGKAHFFCTFVALKIKTIMGRGDKKTEKGKRFKGSFGNARPSKVEKTVAPKAAKTEDKPKKAAAKKAPAKKKATEE